MVNCLEISQVIQAMMLKYGSIRCHSVFSSTLVCKAHLTMFLPFGYKMMIIFSTLKIDCSELRVSWYRETSYSPPVIFLQTVPMWYFFRGYFFMCICLWHIVLSVSCSLVVTCWERAVFLALLYVAFCCVFVTFPYGVLDQVLYLTESIPDLCLLHYFEKFKPMCSSKV